MKVLEDLRIEEKGSIYEMRKEALKTARRLMGEKLGKCCYFNESDLLLAYVKSKDRLKPVAGKILKAVYSGRLKGILCFHSYASGDNLPALQ